MGVVWWVFFAVVGGCFAVAGAVAGVVGAMTGGSGCSHAARPSLAALEWGAGAARRLGVDRRHPPVRRVVLHPVFALDEVAGEFLFGSAAAGLPGALPDVAGGRAGQGQGQGRCPRRGVARTDGSTPERFRAVVFALAA